MKAKDKTEESREIALLILAVLLVMVYLLKGGHFHQDDNQHLQTHFQNPMYIEVATPEETPNPTLPQMPLGEGIEGGGLVYTFEGKDNEVPLKEVIKKVGFKKEVNHNEMVKTGARVTIKPPPPDPSGGEGGIEIGTMDGERHLVLGIPLDINRATARDFEALPGIGPKLAERIVETRTQLGGFKSIDDLKRVKGIGEGKLERIRRYIE